MILTTLALICFGGSTILVGVLSIMRLLYGFGICERPRFAHDPVVAGLSH